MIPGDKILIPFYIKQIIETERGKTYFLSHEVNKLVTLNYPYITEEELLKLKEN